MSKQVHKSVTSDTIINLLCLTLILSSAGDSLAADSKRQYTFSWLYHSDSSLTPRGGLTLGPDVLLTTRDDQPNREPTTTLFEKDKAAILAMQGAYRASFDFIETIGFTKNYVPPAPYQSWGTEFIYLVEEREDFISLQHVLVMRFLLDDGSISEPMVMKHWRQDWQYEDARLHIFTGQNKWERKTLKPKNIEGTWSQSVFQVDDSPRYEGIGRWQHTKNSSIWTSQITYRPLPRREFSVRDDYQMLTGTNRISITNSGWVQEEDNLKTVLKPTGEIDEKLPYLSREMGISRYELIKDFDFSAGHQYWERTQHFWEIVREKWKVIIDEEDEFIILKQVDNVNLYNKMFQLADSAKADRSNIYELRTLVNEIIDHYVVIPKKTP